MWSSIAKPLIALGVGASCVVYAYQTGLSVGDREVAALKSEIGRLSQTVANLRSENAALSKSAETARQQSAALQDCYDRDVPAGEIKELLELARNKLATGIDPSRLAQVIEQTGSLEACENGPITKCFIVRTPLYEGGTTL